MLALLRNRRGMPDSRPASPVSSPAELGALRREARYAYPSASDSMVAASDRSFCVMPPASCVESVQTIFV